MKLRPILGGVGAGLVGGAASALVGDRESLLALAEIVDGSTIATGALVHFVVSAVLGLGFAVLVSGAEGEANGGLDRSVSSLWGMLYGFVWWLVGPITILPILRGEQAAWDADALAVGRESLIAQLVFGLLVGMVSAPGRASRRDRHGLGLLGDVVTALAVGLFAASLHLGDGIAANLLFGLVAGCLHHIFEPRHSLGAGVAIVRAFVVGFAVWFVAEAVIASREAPGGDVDRLPMMLLVFGLGVGVVRHLLSSMARLFFEQDIRRAQMEGIGARSVRAGIGGALAGLFGGWVFSLVMARTGFFPVASSIVGERSAGVGFLVHLGISVVIGISYGLLFRERSFDTLSAVGWGTSYGVVWWVLGPLTLLPLLVDGSVVWSTERVGSQFPALVAHIFYGAFVGYIVHSFERRHNPWWVPRTDVDARRVEKATAQIASAAPALWASVLIAGMITPLLSTL